MEEKVSTTGNEEKKTYYLDILEDMKKKNAKSSILEVRSDNFRAIHIYEAFGYKRISIRKNYYIRNK